MPKMEPKKSIARQKQGAKQPESVIKATKDYDSFRVLTGNRELQNGHVANLTVSILKNNMLAQNPIIVNERMEVVDGQHRLEVARNNDLTIYYIVVPGARIEEVVTLNEFNRSWNGVDFLNSYAARGYKDYVWLKDFMTRYGISLTQALSFLVGNDSSWSHTHVKSGKMTLTDEQKRVAEERADVLWEIRPYIKRSGFIPRAFLLELIHAVNEGWGQKLVNAMKVRGETFMPEPSRKEAAAQIQLLMN